MSRYALRPDGLWSYLCDCGVTTEWRLGAPLFCWSCERRIEGNALNGKPLSSMLPPYPPPPPPPPPPPVPVQAIVERCPRCGFEAEDCPCVRRRSFRALTLQDTKEWLPEQWRLDRYKQVEAAPPAVWPRGEEAPRHTGGLWTCTHGPHEPTSGRGKLGRRTLKEQGLAAPEHQTRVQGNGSRKHRSWVDADRLPATYWDGGAAAD